MDVIVAAPTAAAVAAKNATRTIPIVMWGVGDPVSLGLVASLARPGGNVTGLSFSVGMDTFGKSLELLREAIPKVPRVAVLFNPSNPAHALALDNVKAAARSLGVRLQFLEARGPSELDAAFAAMVKERAAAVLVMADAVFIAQRARLADLAARNRLPTMHGNRESVEAGGLMSYGPSNLDMIRRTAGFVDKILRGAQSATLPVEQPTKFELAINLRTAKALGLTIPSSLLLRADEVIE
jgi:putative ABC transport system substrate-binding protein